MKTQLIFKYIGMGIIAMLLAMCAAEVTTNDTKTYTFSYETTPKGTAATLSPTWNRDVANVTYEINHDTPVGTVIAPTIDTSIGEVTIAIDTTEGSYTISATSADIFTGATAKVYVTVAPAPSSADTTGKTALTTAINEGITIWGDEGDFNYIITTAVTDMSELFTGKTAFNGNISNWDTSAVTNMFKTFFQASAFNQPIGGWNTSAVKYTTAMFQEATSFNQPIGNWNTSAVEYMSNMFEKASAFNKPISKWNTSAVKSTQAMFLKATEFNQDIDNWNVSAVETGKDTYMFKDSGMKSDPCWYDSSAGAGAIRVPRPPSCSVAN